MSIEWKTDGEYIRRGDKEPAQFLCIDSANRAWLKVDGYVVSRWNNGKVTGCGTHEGDIIEKPKKIGGWYNVYRSGFIGDAYKSKEDANLLAVGGRIACVYLEFEEGQGL